MTDKYQEILTFWRTEIDEFDDIVSVKEIAVSDIWELIDRIRKVEEENIQMKTFILGNEYDLTPEFRNSFPNGFK